MSCQAKLVGVMLKWIGEEYGAPGINSRQMNEVVRAADIVIAALESPHRSATKGMGLKAWLASDDTGISSLYMASVLAPLAGMSCPQPGDTYRSFPHDPADFGRCVRLLEAVPELRPFIAALAAPEHGVTWNAIAAEWETLEQWYAEDLPSGRSDRVYNRLQELDEEVVAWKRQNAQRN